METPQDPRRRINFQEKVANNSPPPVYRVRQIPIQSLSGSIDSPGSSKQAGEAWWEKGRQSHYAPAGKMAERQEQVSHRPYQHHLKVINRVTQVIYFLSGLVEVLLALRFLLRFLNVEAGSGFTSFIYNFTAPFVAPFKDIFNDQTRKGAGVLEFSTLVAMAVYSQVVRGLAMLLFGFLGRRVTAKKFTLLPSADFRFTGNRKNPLLINKVYQNER